MKLIALLWCLTLFQIEANADNFIINGVPHYREILYENITLGYYSSLAVDYTTNDLYVSNQMLIINLNTREHKYITGIRNPQSITVDQETRNVYIGTSSGIYSYNVSTSVSRLVGATNIDVMWVNFNKVLYYSKYSTGEMYTLVKELSSKFDNFELSIKNFVIDNDGNIVCVCIDRKLYTLKKGTKYPVFYKGVAVNMVTSDRYGNVFFSAEDGIYKVIMSPSAYVATLEKLLYVNNPREITFDNERNIVYYSVKDLKIYTLKPISKTVNVTYSCSNQVNDRYNDRHNDDSISNKLDNLKQIILKLEDKIDKLHTDIK